MARRGGTIFFKKNGQAYEAKGAFDYNLGSVKRDAIIGQDGLHGFKEIPQVAFIEGSITDSNALNLQTEILDVVSETITLELANGKIIVLDNAYFAGEGTGNSEEGEIAVRFEANKAREIV